MSRLPNFLIIGAQKGGSTWLFDVLKTHKDVFLPNKVELLHFNKRDCCSKENIKAYSDHFKDADESFIAVGEKTPSYLWSFSEKREYCRVGTNHNRNIVKDVAAQLGIDLKIICSLRHPVMRLISAFYHHVQRSRIKKSTSVSEYYYRFGLVDIGFYYQHIREWLKVYPMTNLLVLFMERDVITNPDRGLIKLCEFLGIDPNGIPEIAKASNVGLNKIWREGKIVSHMEKSPYITGEEIKFLIELYQDDMNKLRKLLDDPLEEWKRIDRELLCFAKNYRKKISHDGIGDRSNDGKKPKILDPHQNLLESGIDLSLRACNILKRGTVEIEPPVRLSNVEIFHNSKVGAFSYFVNGSVYNTEVGRYCSIAKSVNIGQGNHPIDWLSTNPFQYEASLKFHTGALYPYHEEYQKFSVPEINRQHVLDSIRKPKTKIGNDVWIGHAVIVNAGVQIGDGAIIGSGSVVTKDIPAYAIVVGVPAKIIRFRFSQDIIEELLELQWWQYSPWSIADIDFEDIKKAISSIKARRKTCELLPYEVPIISPKKYFNDLA